MLISNYSTTIISALYASYQYIHFIRIRDLDTSYSLKFANEKFNKASSSIALALLAINIGLSALSNFTDDNLNTKQKWISFGVDTAYMVTTFGISYGINNLVLSIPNVGPILAPFASIGITLIIDYLNERYGWLDAIKQWLYDL